MVYTTDFARVASTAVFSLSPRGTSGERVGERGSSIVAHRMASTTVRQATPILIRPPAGNAIRFPQPINYQLPSLYNFSEGGLAACCTKSHQIALNCSDFARRCGLSGSECISSHFKGIQSTSKEFKIEFRIPASTVPLQLRPQGSALDRLRTRRARNRITFSPAMNTKDFIRLGLPLDEATPQTGVLGEPWQEVLQRCLSRSATSATNRTRISGPVSAQLTRAAPTATLI